VGSRSVGAVRVAGGLVLSDAQLDALTARHVRVVGHRQARPNLPSDDCPFCPGGLEAPEPYATRWFPNRWPPLPDERAEVLLYSPAHDASLGAMSDGEVRAVIDLWAERTAALSRRDDVAYVLVFENRGREVGATIDHPHGQIYAYDYVPPAPAAELHGGSCTLCAPSPDESEVVRVGAWAARVPALAAWPYELLLQPTAHAPDLVALDGASRDDLAACLRRSIAALDRHFDAAAPYMLWIHQRPCDGRHWPTAHLHVHIAPIWRSAGTQRFVAAAEVGSAVYFNPVDPLEAAAALRAAVQP
jgi:UDPglucose--hexose-1-phosphate uridylyltransferase